MSSTSTCCRTRPDRVVCDGLEGENIVARALEALRGARLGGAAGRGPDPQADPGRRRDGRRLGGRRRDAAGRGAAGPDSRRPARDRGRAGGGCAKPARAGSVARRRAPARRRAARAAIAARARGRALRHRLATADVYREADRLGLPRSAEDGARRDVLDELAPGSGLPAVVNDLEPAAVSLCPGVGSRFRPSARRAPTTFSCAVGPDRRRAVVGGGPARPPRPRRPAVAAGGAGAVVAGRRPDAPVAQFAPAGVGPAIPRPAQCGDR